MSSTTSSTCPRCPRPTRSARLRSCATRSRTPAGGCSASPAALPAARHVERVRRGARSGRRGARTSRSPRARSAALLAPATSPMSPLMVDRGLGRCLDDVRTSASTTSAAPAKSTEGSVNDVFVAAIVGGLNRYHERHGVVTDSLRMTPADQPAHRGRRRGRQPLRAGALPGARRRRRSGANACRRSARSCATGAPSRRCR